MTAAEEAVACVVSPNAADAELAIGVLSDNGIAARAFPSLVELAYALDHRAACVILVEEALVREEVPALREAMGRLPAWSDLPLVVVGRDVAALGQAVASEFPSSGNVTLLERPLNPHTLVSAAQVALRATARQREVGELLEQRDQAVKARDEFLAMLAHELRNPLAPMRNAVYLLRMQRNADPDLVATAGILERQVDHVTRLLDDLLDVARLERGKVVLQKRRVDLNQVVAGAIETCLPGAQQKGHRIAAHFSNGPLPVEGDPVRLEQIVCNLLNNGVKFSPEAGEIRVHTAIEDGAAVVRVEDRGIGFDPVAADRLFDPFMQVNPTLARSAGGLGMGLTIVKRLAELHGGSVHGESEGVGKGSRFSVRIPLAEAAAEAAEPAQEAGPAARVRRIVLVEDNEDIRATFRALASFWGHDVVAMAADGPAGVDAIVANRPDIALVDIGLPGMSGYEVARAVRNAMPGVQVRLVALTGYGQPSDRERAVEAGFDSHLLKPIAPESLQRLLCE